ncbi:MAG: DUF6893 family small protein [Gammaproteobacteria bacterium]
MWTIFWIIVALLAAYIVKQNLPDIVRYLKIRAM